MRFLDLIGLTRPAGTDLLPWWAHVLLAVGALGVAAAAVVSGGPAWVAVLLVVLGAVNALIGLRRRRSRRSAGGRE